jgi:hypothetical protein
VSAAKQVWNQLPGHHSITALRVRNFLATNAADLIAHVTVHYAPHKRHARNVVHAIPNEKRGSCHRGCRCQKSIDLFGKMLTIGIKEDDPMYLRLWSAAGRSRSAKPMRQSGLNRFTFAAIFIVNNNLGASFVGALSRLIGRAVVNDENVIKPLARSARDIADVFFVLIRRDNRSGLRSKSRFYHVERSRLSSRSFMRRLKISQY